MILVTGGTGSMGRRLVAKLTQQGHRVRVLALPNDPLAPAIQSQAVDIHFGNIVNPISLLGIAEGVKLVYHLAAVILSPGRPDVFNKVNVEGTRNLLAECEKAPSVRHFIYISSASVTYPRTNPYAASKAGAEEIVRNTSIPHHTIVRPTLAYEENGGIEFMHFVQYLKRYPVVPFIGSGKALKAPVHVDDIIQGLAGIAENPKTHGKIYGFSGGQELPIRNMAELLLAKTGQKKAIVPIPVFLCRAFVLLAAALGKITGKPSLLTWQTISGIIQDANLDNQIAKDDLGYTPRTFTQGLDQIKQLQFT